MKPPNISLDEFIRQMINTIHKEDLHFFHLFHLSNNSPGQDAADVEEKTKILLEWKNVRQRATLAEHVRFIPTFVKGTLERNAHDYEIAYP